MIIETMMVIESKIGEMNKSIWESSMIVKENT
jgi:hypothetical protein